MREENCVMEKMTIREKTRIKRAKIRWHLNNKYEACELSGGICQVCKVDTNVKNGVIHHLIYPKAWWELDIAYCLLFDICQWWCKKCHNEHHLARNINESEKYLKSGGYCHFCHRLIYDGWERAKSLGQKECICNSCYIKRKRVNKKQMRFEI